MCTSIAVGVGKTPLVRLLISMLKDNTKDNDKDDTTVHGLDNLITSNYIKLKPIKHNFHIKATTMARYTLYINVPWML